MTRPARFRGPPRGSDGAAMSQARALHKVAEGREAELYAWEDGTLLRLLRDPEGQHRNDWQRAAMAAARASGVRVPIVHGLTTVWGRPGLVMERVEGPDLLTLLGRRPWQLLRAARICGEVHARLHAVRAPERLPALRGTLRERIAASPRVPQHLTRPALDLLDALPDGDRLCHGDFHPGNLLMGQGTPVVIDWSNAARGHPEADVARTVLLLRLGEPPPGSPVLIRLLARVARRVLLAGYLRAYRRVRSLDMQRVGQWETVQAVERLDEDIAGELPALERLLRQRPRMGP